MRYALIFSLVALPAFAQDNGPPDSEAEPPVGGVGRLACGAIVGAENAAYLGQAGDWAMGYMAGRIDAGEEVLEDATLSPDDAVDVVSGIAVRCRENPDQPVIQAVRTFAERVFGAEAQAGPVTADAPPPAPDMPESAASDDSARRTVPPEPRPETAAPEPDDDASDTEETSSSSSEEATSADDEPAASDSDSED